MNSKSYEKEYSLKTIVAGGLSNIIPRILVQPLDVIKIRFQLQVEPIAKSDSSYYKSIYQASTRILKEEGITAFWKGHIPAQALSVVYGAVQFSTFEYLKRLGNDYNSFGNNFICGGFAGITATICSTPLDVLRTRFVAQGSKKVYSSLKDSIRQISSQDSYRGFFRGVIPACLLIYPQTAIQFSVYHFLKNLSEPGYINATYYNLLAGGIAGFVSKTAVYPLDLTKKRLQTQNFEIARKPFGKYHQTDSMRQCLVDIVRKERFLSLYKGWLVSCIKTTLYSASAFASYEFFMRTIM